MRRLIYILVVSVLLFSLVLALPASAAAVRANRNLRTPTRTHTPKPTSVPTRTATPTPMGPYAGKPAVSIQNISGPGGNSYDVAWVVSVNPIATSWTLTENGVTIYSAALTPNAAGQSGSYHLANKAPGVYTYQVFVSVPLRGSTASDPLTYTVAP